MQVPEGESVPRDNRPDRPNIHHYLATSERLLSSFAPFYATNYRVMRLDPPSGPSRGHLLEIPYQNLASVDMVRRANHPSLGLGAVMVILGLLMTPFLPISALFMLPLGGVFLYIGARGKPGYFQLQAREMPKQAQKYWQVNYERSGSFIATLRSAIGQMPEF